MASDQSQRTNLFHARCKVQGRLCILIIDGSSCTNIASTYLVERLSLPTLDHPQPYKLHWLDDSSEVLVNKQVYVSFSIGKYHDKVLYDVVPMDMSHLLLGRPWEFDNKVTSNCFSN